MNLRWLACQAKHPFHWCIYLSGGHPAFQCMYCGMPDDHPLMLDKILVLHNGGLDASPRVWVRRNGQLMEGLDCMILAEGYDRLPSMLKEDGTC